MRTLITGLTVAVMTILLAPTAAMGSVFGTDDSRRQLPLWCMKTWARSICWAAGVRIVIHGGENIQRDRGAVYASNHVSWFDIFAIASILPRYTFVAKAELRRIPIFGWGAEACGVVFLERENRSSAFDVYRAVAEKVSAGLSVVVCPEGTRGDSYALRPFKKGPFVLAIAAAAPVVPVVVYGTREIMPKGTWRVRSGTVHVHFLPAVETTGYDYDHRHALMKVVWQKSADTLTTTYSVTQGGRAVTEQQVEGAA
ncbi:MAG: 1-acyl-sn-glycerol-3-phosphate acyltransferase [Gemmatimonadota bacterium]|nr:1-acyl-sn-glycerol-3-phosphate acyltransferase [Gemmatimonadota bacterium]